MKIGIQSNKRVDKSRIPSDQIDCEHIKPTARGCHALCFWSAISLWSISKGPASYALCLVPC
jgi:hypothetical protein